MLSDPSLIRDVYHVHMTSTLCCPDQHKRRFSSPTSALRSPPLHQKNYGLEGAIGITEVFGLAFEVTDVTDNCSHGAFLIPYMW